MKFEPGSLYKPRINSEGFPGFRGSKHIYTTKDIDHYFNENSVALILEPLYTLRSKLRRVKESEPVRYEYWVCKVMIDDKVGYIEMWEDEWEKIS